MVQCMEPLFVTEIRAHRTPFPMYASLLARVTTDDLGSPNHADPTPINSIAFLTPITHILTGMRSTKHLFSCFCCAGPNYAIVVANSGQFISWGPGLSLTFLPHD